MAEGEADLPQRRKRLSTQFHHQSGLKTGSRLGPNSRPRQPPKQPKITCPQCGSSRFWKDGLRYTGVKPIQRWLCRACGFRFSQSASNSKVKVNVSRQLFKKPNSGKDLLQADILQCDFAVKPSPKNSPLKIREHVASHNPSKKTVAEKVLNSFADYNRERCVSEGLAVSETRKPKALEGMTARTRGWEPPARGCVKALSETETRQEAAQREGTRLSEDAKGKIIEFAWWLKKKGRSQATIENYTTMLRLLIKAGADLFEPETVKDTLARLKKKNGWKYLAVAAYTAFLKMHGGKWEPPTYKPTRKLPFIPTEREIDDLIACCGKKTAAFLQLLKETGMRAGEANKLPWTDVDLERRFITLNQPEKSGNPRIFKISVKLAKMLGALPRNSERVFGDSKLRSKFVTFRDSRRNAAKKLGNPRLLRIHFHTLRHWKATMEYHKTKDPFYVKELLGHRNLDTTSLYIQLDKTLFQETNDEFHFATARTVEEAGKLIKVGFEYICHHEGVMLLRKRK